MARPDRDAIWALPTAAAVLLWPALWNGYPIVFADTGTYLSQAIHRYLGWDRPPFYSLFMLPLHATVSTWPVVAVQALLTVCTLRLVCRTLLPDFGTRWLPIAVLPLAIGTWLPFLVCQLMPDVLTPLLVLILCAGLPHWRWAALAAFAVAAQQSSLLLSAAILPFCGAPWRRLCVPLVVAALALLAVNRIGHGRLAISPFGNVFLLARVIYDGPGMDTLRRDCPAAGWRLCGFLDRFPATSDEFLWRPDSPIVLAGGHKAVSADADAIVSAALRAEPGRELAAVLRNGWEQLTRFESGDGLEAWPVEVTPWIERDFPPAEAARYAAGRQARGLLALPAGLADLHRFLALAGIVGCLGLLPLALKRRHRAAAFLLTTLLALPVSAIVTGALSTPHDRYQSRIAWLPPFIATLSAVALFRRPP